MKKLISLALVAVMLFACAAASIPASALASAENIQYVEAKYFDVKPVIDGYVTEAEWGEITFGVEQDEAATKDDSAPVNNTYFTHDGTYEANSLKMSYVTWLRWDENYFYIATKVNDPDGHSLKNGRNETWNGDAMQTRIDPNGANGICYGAEFDPVNDDPKNHKPWGDARVCDLVFGYCQMAGGFQEAYENVSEKSMLANEFYTPALGVCDLAIIPAGAQYSTDSANGITTYEIAVPWAYIDSWYAVPKQDANAFHQYYKEAAKEKTENGVIVQGPNGAIGREYGMSLVVLNADGNSGAGKYNAYLIWGSGICDSQQREAVNTCGGSNSVVLSADKVSADSKYTGSYTTYTKGGIPETEPEPHYSFTIDESNYIKLTYDSEDDMNVFGWISNGERVQDTDGNWVVKWDKDTGNGPTSPSESGLNENNYLTTEGELQDGSDVRWTANNASFTYEFDIKVTGLENFEDGYAPTVYTWFGGANSVSYRCGYFFDDGVFKVADSVGKSEADSTTIVSTPADFTLNEWHHWVFQYDNATCTMRFYFDPQMENGRVAQSAVPVFNVFYKYFDYGAITNPFFILRRLNCQIMVDNLELYNFVDYTKTNKKPDPIPEDPTDGDKGGPITTKGDAGAVFKRRDDGTGEFTLNNKEEYTKADVTALSFIADYDAEKVSFKGVEALDEGKYTVEDDKNGTVTIKITDLSILKEIPVGETLLQVIFTPLEGVELSDDDFAKAVNIEYSLTRLSSATGDALIYISVALAVVVVIGTAAVFCYRRRKNTVSF